MKTLKVLLLLVVIGGIVNYFVEQMGGSKKTTTTASTEQVSLGEFNKVFADDPHELLSNLSNDYVHSGHLPEVEFTLGTPNKRLVFPDSSCASQPIIVNIYDDMKAADQKGVWLDSKAYALVYWNLHCQPDPRAYVLVGIHPIPGLWWNKVFPNGRK